MADLPVAQADAMLSAAFVPATTYYLSLHTADPGLTGASEVTGGSYARQALTMGTPASGSQASTDAQSFTSMPAVTVTYIGIWTAATGGTYLGGGATTTSLVVSAGGTVSFAIGAVTLAVS